METFNSSKGKNTEIGEENNDKKTIDNPNDTLELRKTFYEFIKQKNSSDAWDLFEKKYITQKQYQNLYNTIDNNPIACEEVIFYFKRLHEIMAQNSLWKILQESDKNAIRKLIQTTDDPKALYVRIMVHLEENKQVQEWYLIKWLISDEKMSDKIEYLEKNHYKMQYIQRALGDGIISEEEKKSLQLWDPWRVKKELRKKYRSARWKNENWGNFNLHQGELEWIWPGGWEKKKKSGYKPPYIPFEVFEVSQRKNAVRLLLLNIQDGVLTLEEAKKMYEKSSIRIVSEILTKRRDKQK